MDENLKQRESVLDVTIARRGEHFSLRGKSAQTLLATEALRNFYSQTQHHLSIEQIQLGLIEVMNPHHSVKPATINVPAKETPVLITRRSDLRGRTPRQVQYLQQIQEHDITVSIGPAGTGKSYLDVAGAGGEVERDVVVRIGVVGRAG